jgi:tRNA threonylcarbamoyl adenosine modification protein (Sua5/YciO/YrdC/YwlC family)
VTDLCGANRSRDWAGTTATPTFPISSELPGTLFMPAVVIDLKKTDDPRDVVHRSVQALAEGKLVVFPTETVYGLAASALSPGAVERILQIKGRDPSRPMALAIKSSDDALDYVPDLSPLAQRLARRCWPGPLTLVLDDAHPDSVIHELSDVVRAAVAPQGTIGLRVPAHAMIQAVLRLCAGPLVLTSANRSGAPDAVTAAETMELGQEDVALILDDGRCKFAQPSSVVYVNQNRLRVLRAGVFPSSSLKQLASYMIFLVCTGNTCRSPMAEIMLKHKLAAKLGVPAHQLEDRGLMVGSAGISAMAGSGPSPEAVQVMNARQLDLSRHESQPLSERLVRFADMIITMTRGHRDAILSQWPDAAGRVYLLCHDQSDVADPIGGPSEMYERCAEQIEQELDRWVNTLDIPAMAGMEPGSGD